MDFICYAVSQVLSFWVKSRALVLLHDDQVVAGVWHGLFPGYALFFVTSAFMFESAKVIYRYEQVGRPEPNMAQFISIAIF